MPEAVRAQPWFPPAGCGVQHLRGHGVPRLPAGGHQPGQDRLRGRHRQRQQGHGPLHPAQALPRAPLPARQDQEQGACQVPTGVTAVGLPELMAVELWHCPACLSGCSHRQTRRSLASPTVEGCARVCVWSEQVPCSVCVCTYVCVCVSRGGLRSLSRPQASEQEGVRAPCPSVALPLPV